MNFFTNKMKNGLKKKELKIYCFECFCIEKVKWVTEIHDSSGATLKSIHSSMISRKIGIFNIFLLSACLYVHFTTDTIAYNV